MKENELSSEPLTSVAVYNPALLKKEELIAQFVARRALLDRLIEELRGSGNNGRRHQLIVGARGSGKTMLLGRLCYAIEDTAELCSRWFPLVFPEEQYNVSRLSDLWVNCLDALSDMLERRDREGEAGQLDQRLDELPADDEKRRAQAALDLLIGWAKKEDRGLVLLIDNADLIFDRLKNHHQAIREALSADNRLIIIGATNTLIEAIYDKEGAFHDFFKINELRGLNHEETSEALRTLARLRRTPHVTELLDRDPGRIRSLNLLAGGNLRTVVVLYQALAQGADDSVRADLEQLLDQYTPLYKHQFEALSAQSQQVVDALALNWDPATAADLAGKLRLDTNAVSAVLNRLVKDGIVEKAPSPPGEKMYFQIAERFFNIWYLMRANRRVRRRLMWLVEFLKMFYGSAELNRRARQLVQEPPPPEPDQFRRAELALLFAGAVKKPGLRRALEIEGVRSLMNCEDRQRLSSTLDLEGADASLKDMVERFQSLGALSEKVEQTKGELPPEFLEYLLAAPTLSLEEKKRTFEDVAKLGSTENKDLIEKFESEAKRFVELFGGETCRELFESIRDGQMADGADVEGADAAAIKGKDASLRVIARLFRFDRTKDKALLDQAEGILTAVQSPHVWLSWAEAVASSENHPKKLAGMCKRAVKLKGHDARTWQRTGELQFHLGQFAEAESSFRKSMALDPDAFASWNDLGYLLAYCRGSFDEAEMAYHRAIELDPKAASPWFRLGDLLQRYLKRDEEAEAAFRKATELAPHVVLPWGFLFQLLMHELKKYEEAEAVCRRDRRDAGDGRRQARRRAKTRPRSADTTKKIAGLKRQVNCNDSNTPIQNHPRQHGTRSDRSGSALSYARRRKSLDALARADRLVQPRRFSQRHSPVR
ncbi:MAG TPA: AAA family ATPase [Blastocatellia bacterium]|nr:AAA family ATPase [Blastocatellia bacterium]